MKQLKMLVFDVDGTLYDLQHHEIPMSCREAIRKAKEQGYLFVIATGRAHYGLGKAIESLQPDYILSVNGGVVVDQKGSVVSHHDFSLEDTEQLINFCKKQEAGLIFKFLDHMYLYQNPEKVTWLAPQMASDIGTEPFIDHPQQNMHLTQLPQAACIHAPTSAIEEAFKDSTTISFLPYGNDGFDVVPKGLHKGVGLRELMQYLNLSKEEVACFGDNYNDIEMMQVAGTSVAMGNAADEIKELADFVTASTDQDGIYLALEHLHCI